MENILNKLMDNPIVVGLMALALTMYGPRLAPKLPQFIRDAFNNSGFRMLILILVVFVGLRDIRLSLVIAVLFVVILNIVGTQDIKENFKYLKAEYFSNNNLFDRSNIEYFNCQDEEESE